MTVPDALAHLQAARGQRRDSMHSQEIKRLLRIKE
jgi:hypothetical protein